MTIVWRWVTRMLKVATERFKLNTRLVTRNMFRVRPAMKTHTRLTKTTIASAGEPHLRHREASSVRTR